MQAKACNEKKYKNFILDQFPFFIDESANLSYKTPLF